jgi:hypothetical protein
LFRTTKVFNKNTCKTASSNCGFKARSGSTTTAAAEEMSEAVFALGTRISSISLAPLPNAFGVFAAALMNDYEQIDVMQCKKKGFKKITKNNLDIHFESVCLQSYFEVKGSLISATPFLGA